MPTVVRTLPLGYQGIKTLVAMTVLSTDYRVPVVLRQFGVLQYSQPLARLVRCCFLCCFRYPSLFVLPGCQTEADSCTANLSCKGSLLKSTISKRGRLP